MGYVTAAAFPVLPGQEDRVKNFEQEVAAHREEWERLSRESTFSGYHVIYQPSPMGDLAIHVFDIEDPTKVRPTFEDTPTTTGGRTTSATSTVSTSATCLRYRSPGRRSSPGAPSKAGHRADS